MCQKHYLDTRFALDGLRNSAFTLQTGSIKMLLYNQNNSILNPCVTFIRIFKKDCNGENVRLFIRGGHCFERLRLWPIGQPYHSIPEVTMAIGLIQISWKQSQNPRGLSFDNLRLFCLICDVILSPPRSH